MPDKEKIFQYLNSLRESGAINMFEGGHLLQEHFGLDRHRARAILIEWMQNFSNRKDQKGN
jgi:hypothetical protein